MFESNYNYVPNPYPPAPQPGPMPMPGPAPGYQPYPQPMPGPMPPAPVYIDNTLSIPGAAADAAVTGALLASKLSLDKLQGTIKLIDDKLELDGIVDAEIGQVPSKGEDGTLTWFTAAKESDVISIRDAIQAQINSINSELDTAEARLDELFNVNARQDTAIADIRNLVNELNSVLNGTEEEPGVFDRVDTLEEQVEELTETLSQKLDASDFNDFLNTVVNGEDGLVARLTTLEGCCEDVHVNLEGLQDQIDSINNILGGPENYDQPVYMTLNELKNMDIDGGDLDEEVEP